MTISLWCLLIVGLLPIVCTAIAKGGAPGFDNRNPREWFPKLQGWRARANAAQKNSWEAFALFTAGIVAAHFSGAPQAKIDTLAIAFIAARMAYIGCYVGGLATLRSLVWLVGLVLTIALFVIGA